MNREIIYRTDALAAVGNLKGLSATDKIKAMGAVLCVPGIICCQDCRHVQHDEVFDRYWCNGREVTAEWFCADGEEEQHD